HDVFVAVEVIVEGDEAATLLEVVQPARRRLLEERPVALVQPEVGALIDPLAAPLRAVRLHDVEPAVVIEVDARRAPAISAVPDPRGPGDLGEHVASGVLIQLVPGP